MSALLRLLRPRLRRVDFAIGALLAALGFALVVQVSSTQRDGLLASARQEDLVQILDDLSNRDERLRQEVAALSASRERLSSGSGTSRAALAEARRRTQLLGVLAGTVAATGPGVTLTITDPHRAVGAAVLVDALEELRDAGAEAVQLEGRDGSGGTRAVRVVAATFLVDEPAGIRVDGTLLSPPYRYATIGDPATLAAALAIPGGVLDNVAHEGGRAVVHRQTRLRVGALRALDRPRYARPTAGG